MKKTFTREYLTKTLGLPDDGECVISDTILDLSRWSAHHDLIFRDFDGKLYETGYSVGLTEQQDESAWEYEETVDCYEVYETEVLTKVWLQVQDTTEIQKQTHITSLAEDLAIANEKLAKIKHLLSV